MKCFYCGHEDTKVVDSRPSEDGKSIRRRRECLECTKRFTTYESVEIMPVLVMKSDGRREPFDRLKIKKGILLAVEKIGISLELIDKMVDNIHKKIANSLIQEISSDKIGDYVLAELRNVSAVAYIRFASVYRKFTDVESFMEELKSLPKDK